MNILQSEEDGGYTAYWCFWSVLRHKLVNLYIKHVVCDANEVISGSANIWRSLYIVLVNLVGLVLVCMFVSYLCSCMFLKNSEGTLLSESTWVLINSSACCICLRNLQLDLSNHLMVSPRKKFNRHKTSRRKTKRLQIMSPFTCQIITLISMATIVMVIRTSLPFLNKKVKHTLVNLILGNIFSVLMWWIHYQHHQVYSPDFVSPLTRIYYEICC